MPAAIAVPALATVIGGGVAAGATVYGSRKAGQSAKRASQIQSKSDDAALQYEKERDAEAKRQWEAQQAFESQKWQAQEEQRLHDRQLADALEARRAPYRAASQAALGRLGEMLGLNFDTSTPSAAIAPAGSGAPAPLPPQSRLMSSPMLGGAPEGMSTSKPYDATQPDYAAVNPMAAGPLLGLRRRPLTQRYA